MKFTSTFEIKGWDVADSGGVELMACFHGKPETGRDVEHALELERGVGHDRGLAGDDLADGLGGPSATYSEFGFADAAGDEDFL